MMSIYTCCENPYSTAGHQPKLRCKQICSHTGHSEMRLKLDSIAINGQRIIILALLHDKGFKQLSLSDMGIEKTRLLACESIYWINMNGDIEEIVKKCIPCLDFQATQPKNKTICTPCSYFQAPQLKK